MPKRRRNKHTKQNRNPSRPDPLDLVHPHAAGIDLGSERHFVAVPADRCDAPVQSFACFTADLYRMANWMKECGITTVAMEATGVYWVPVFQVLETRGFQVWLVNPRHLKNVPGRKTDVQDCQWIQRLHSYGLLSSSFRPDDATCVLRSYVRQRSTLVEQSTRHVQRMQKACIQMNIHLHKVIRDISGVTGLRILRAIVAGERDPKALAQLKDPRIQSSSDKVAAALQGDFREEHVFVLAQELMLYDTLREQIQACDAKIEACVQKFPDQSDGQQPPPPRQKKPSKQPALRHELFRMTGVDLTSIEGIDSITAQHLLAEIGTDMTRWQNSKAFCAWLALCPRNRITGGKVMSSRTQPTPNRAAAALRRAAQALARSHSALGAYYRRMRARLGAPKAITATAHKLARTIYALLSRGHSYVDPGIDAYEQRYTQRVIRNLERKAKVFGFKLLPIPQTESGVS